MPTLSKARVKIQNINMKFKIDDSVADGTYLFKGGKYYFSTWLPSVKYAIATNTLHEESQEIVLSQDSYQDFKQQMFDLIMEIEES